MNERGYNIILVRTARQVFECMTPSPNLAETANDRRGDRGEVMAWSTTSEELWSPLAKAARDWVCRLPPPTHEATPIRDAAGLNWPAASPRGHTRTEPP